MILQAAFSLVCTLDDIMPDIAAAVCTPAGTQWLIWKYESDSTLGDALFGSLGAFPECLAPYILRGNG